MIDPSLLKAYQLGIAIGLLMMSTLILFPGRTEHSADGSMPPQQQLAYEAGGVDQNISEEDVSNMQRQRKPHAFPPADRKTSPPNVAVDSYWTPHRRLNAAIYAILIGAMIVLTVQSYSDGGKRNPTTLLNVLWRLYFPKEAAVLRGPQKPSHAD